MFNVLIKILFFYCLDNTFLNAIQKIYTISNAMEANSTEFSHFKNRRKVATMKLDVEKYAEYERLQRKFTPDKKKE